MQRPDGSHAYTRSGEFSIRPDHTLVNTAGGLVLSDGGSPIVLQPEGGKVTINADGSIVQGSTTVGRIAVQNFADKSQLVPIAGGLFVASSGATATPVPKPTILQGYLEGSNVAPLREMVNLVLISRAYDANQRVITNTDDQMQKTLTALG